MSSFGKKQWLIPDMYWPENTAPDGVYVSHEAICVINASDQDCEIEIDFLFEKREPICGVKAVCSAMRTNHIRLDQLKNSDGDPLIPRGVGYAAVVRCSIPAAVQYTRVDTSQPELALMSTMAFPVD